MEENENVRKYLIHLYEEGWSELICVTYKERVRRELEEKFPGMSEEEWERLSSFLFWAPEERQD